MKNKKVSVIMGVHNCEKTLSKALDSIINQTYENWEIIICDDGSIDNTYSVMQDYKEKFPEKIKMLKNSKNMHLAYSLNCCLKEVSGEYIARMDGDDISLPERFEKQVEFLENNDDFDLCGTCIQYVAESGERGKILYCDEYPDEKCMGKHTPFNHATVMVKKEVYEALGGYTVLPRTVRCEDQDFWYRFFKAGYKGANLQEVLYLVSEDETAYKRRTAQSRLNLFKTHLYGYKLLNFPKTGYIGLALQLIKILVPKKLMYKISKSRK